MFIGCFFFILILLWVFLLSVPFHKLPYPPSLEDNWLASPVEQQRATFAKHAAPNAMFTNAGLTLTATTLRYFLGFHVPGQTVKPWEVSPKFLLEVVPFAWLPDVATSQLHPFPHGDEAEMKHSGKKPARLQPEAGLRAPVQSIPALMVILDSVRKGSFGKGLHDAV